MSSIKKLAGQTAAYGLSSILARTINFLLVPFYTQLMPPSTYGVLSEYMVYIAFFIIFLTFGLETTYFRYTKDQQNEKNIYSQLFTTLFSWTIIWVILILIAAPQIKISLGPSGNLNYIYLLSVILFLDAVTSLPFARLRFQNKALQFAGLKLFNILVNVFLNLLFLWILPEIFKLNEFLGINLNDKVACILWANLIANGSYLIYFIKDFALLFQYWDKEFFEKYMKYAYPIMILGLAGLVNELIDRLMLKEILPIGFYDRIDSLAALGIYSANYKFAIFITLAIQAYRYAAEPFFFKTGAEPNSKETFSKLMTIFTSILLISATLIALYKEEIGFILLRKNIYRTGLVIVPILLLANVCVGIYYNLSAWYKLSDKTIWGTIIGIYGAVITIILNLILIPKLGYLGCAWATLVCYSSMMIFSYIMGKKHYPIPYEIKKIGILFLISITTIVFSSSIATENWISTLGLKSILAVGFLIAIYFISLKEYVSKLKKST